MHPTKQCNTINYNKNKTSRTKERLNEKGAFLAPTEKLARKA